MELLGVVRANTFWVSFVQSGVGPGNARYRDEKKGQKDGQSGMRGQPRVMARGKGAHWRERESTGRVPTKGHVVFVCFLA